MHLRIYIAQSQRRSYLFVHLYVYIYIAYLFDTSSIYEFAPRFLFNELAFYSAVRQSDGQFK